MRKQLSTIVLAVCAILLGIGLAYGLNQIGDLQREADRAADQRDERTAAFNQLAGQVTEQQTLISELTRRCADAKGCTPVVPPPLAAPEPRDDGEVQEPEIQEPEIQDPEVNDPDPDDPETQDPEVDDAPVAGPSGTNGTDGKDGAQGAQGEPGPAGPQGPAGTALPGTYSCPSGEVLTGFTVAGDGSVSVACQPTIPAAQGGKP